MAVPEVRAGLAIVRGASACRRSEARTFHPDHPAGTSQW
jgi:hypothetical protein